ncbi:aldo/keto reductase, partial [Candidatus Bipolaricaulota bacterium]|nr:aldo/keto reductase [Candidatus Bipolaricaulota bacterium]
MSEIPEMELKSGEEIPVLGFGTWNLGGDVVKRSVRDALELGYTHIDTAEGYHNEEEIGEVLEDYERDRLFLTSKVLPTNLHYDDVLESCNRTLEKLGTSYLDLYLIHWPNPAISIRETLSAFERLHEEGKVKNIGVSNFSYYQLRIARKISELPISVNQVEFHPWYHDEALLDYCQERDIHLTASAPLA